MRAYIRIGTIKSNKSGVGSRAWCIERKGTVVYRTWGAVEVTKRSGATRFSWAPGWPEEKPNRCLTVEGARAFIERRIDEQTREGATGGYQRLPAGTRIYRRPRP